MVMPRFPTPAQLAPAHASRPMRDPLHPLSTQANVAQCSERKYRGPWEELGRQVASGEKHERAL